MVGNPTNLNHAKYKKILKPLLVQILKVKVFSFILVKKVRFSSVKMGNSIEQHRSAIGSFNARKKNKKEGSDLFWVSLRDLVLVVVTLQLLFLGILALQYNLPLHASLEADVLIFSPVAGKVRANLRCVCVCACGEGGCCQYIHCLFCR